MLWAASCLYVSGHPRIQSHAVLYGGSHSGLTNPISQATLSFAKVTNLVLTLTTAFRPRMPSIALQKLVLSRSIPKTESSPRVLRLWVSAARGADSVALNATRVVVPNDMFDSNVSAPPNALRTLQVAL